MATARKYSVWIKGRRSLTERLITADDKAQAIWFYSRQMGAKMIEVDAMLLRAVA